MHRISWFPGSRSAKKSCHHSNPLKVKNASLIFYSFPPQSLIVLPKLQVNVDINWEQTYGWEVLAWLCIFLRWFLVSSHMNASTFASTPLQIACKLLIYIDNFLLKLLIILWSQVQVLVGPPNWKGTYWRHRLQFVLVTLLAPFF